MQLIFSVCEERYEWLSYKEVGPCYTAKVIAVASLFLCIVDWEIFCLGDTLGWQVMNILGESFLMKFISQIEKISKRCAKI